MKMRRRRRQENVVGEVFPVSYSSAAAATAASASSSSPSNATTSWKQTRRSRAAGRGRRIVVLVLVTAWRPLVLNSWIVKNELDRNKAGL